MTKYKILTISYLFPMLLIPQTIEIKGNSNHNNYSSINFTTSTYLLNTDKLKNEDNYNLVKEWYNFFVASLITKKKVEFIPLPSNIRVKNGRYVFYTESELLSLTDNSGDRNIIYEFIQKSKNDFITDLKTKDRVKSFFDKTYFPPRLADYQFIFYKDNKGRTRDMVGAVAYASMVEERIKAMKYGVNSEMQYTSSDNLYQPGKSLNTLPSSMTSILQEVLLDIKINLKKQLPDSQFAKIANAKIAIANTGMIQFMRNSPSDTTVIFSPSLARSAFLLSMDEKDPQKKLIPIKEGNVVSLVSDASRSKQRREQYQVASEVIQNYKSSFNFLFHHELAHLYLAPYQSKSESNEYKCDCYALLYGMGQKEYYSTGLWRTFIEQADDSTSIVLWGVDPNARRTIIEKRVKSINRILGTKPVAGACDTLK